MTLEQLKDYLSRLPDTARAKLLEELETSGIAASQVPTVQILLQTLRECRVEETPPDRRADVFLRALFMPLEPFMTGEDTETKVNGRISRPAISRIWDWVERSLAQEEIAVAREEYAKALDNSDSSAAEMIIQRAQDQTRMRVRQAIKAIQEDPVTHRRVISEIGGERSYEDLVDLTAILAFAEPLSYISGRLPLSVKKINDDNALNFKAILEAPSFRNTGAFPYGLAILYERLTQPSQIVKFITFATGFDDPGLILKTPYAHGIELLLADLELQVKAERQCLARRDMETAGRIVTDFHLGAKAMRTEMDLGSDGRWAKRLAKLRADIANMLTPELDSLSGRIRRLLRLQKRDDGLPLKFDTLEKDELGQLIDFLMVCRPCASEIAMNELTQRTFSEIQSYLDTSMSGLIDAVRAARGADRAVRQQQAEAAVEFCAKIFGPSYAQLQTKALEVASADERRAAK